MTTTNPFILNQHESVSVPLTNRDLFLLRLCLNDIISHHISPALERRVIDLRDKLYMVEQQVHKQAQHCADQHARQLEAEYEEATRRG